MSKMSVIEEIIFEVLEDGEWHSIEEIKGKVLEHDKLLLENKNFLNVVLNRIKTKKKLIESEGRGKYKMIQRSTEEPRDSRGNNSREKMLLCWRNFYNKTMSKYELSFDMTEEQFKEGKWLYELNKEMEILIKSFDIS